jgi:hypothetical protein
LLLTVQLQAVLQLALLFRRRETKGFRFAPLGGAEVAAFPSGGGQRIQSLPLRCAQRALSGAPGADNRRGHELK